MSTVEEIEEASLILHVVDISHPNAANHSDEVEKILHTLNVDQKPRMLVLNKVDLLPAGADSMRSDGEDDLHGFDAPHDAIMVSALERTGLTGLLNEVERQLGLSDSAKTVYALSG